MSTKMGLIAGYPKLGLVTCALKRRAAYACIRVSTGSLKRQERKNLKIITELVLRQAVSSDQVT